MKVVYSDAHLRHAPAHELTARGATDHPDTPQRAIRILEALHQAGGFEVVGPADFGPDALLAVHDPAYVAYLASAYRGWVAAGESPLGVIPHCLAGRSMRRRPAGVVGQAGFHCFDVATPIVAGTCEAALAAANVALTAAELLSAGQRLAYALCRPPGHHAGGDYCGGYCYFNNAALAAAQLLNPIQGPTRRGDAATRRGGGTRRPNQSGKVAILDLDYHHGNGTQDIFYSSGQVFYASLHADPDFAYPFYSGYADETGAGEGLGTTLNLPLPADAEENVYLPALDKALEAIARFGSKCLVVSLGTDAFRSDPIGGLGLSVDSFWRIGQRVSQLALPTLVVQEGGYDLATIGRCVCNFLTAL